MHVASVARFHTQLQIAALRHRRRTGNPVNVFDVKCSPRPLCICMYMVIYMYIGNNPPTYPHTHTHTHTHTHVMYVCMYVRMYACMYV